MLAKFFAFSTVVIILGAASYVFVSNNLISQKGQIVITDKDIAAPGSRPVTAVDEISISEVDDAVISVAAPTSPGASRTLGDLSSVTTLVDGYGNRTESRVFSGDPRLRMVMVRTGAGGFQKVYVYGKNGGVKTLSDVSGETALSMTADQLANKAEMFETALDKERQKPKLASNSENSLRPLSSSDIQINSSSNPKPDEPSARLESSTSEDNDGR
jgi:hypothetical protein